MYNPVKNKIHYCTTEIMRTSAKNYFSTFWKKTQVWQKNIKDAICVPSGFDSESNTRYKLTEIPLRMGLPVKTIMLNFRGKNEPTVG